jgi:phosphatidylglycerophosphate synthase
MTMPSPTVTAEYRAEDRAILLRLYQALFLDRLLAVLPPRLKPNTITLVGEASAILAAFAAAGAVRGWPILYLASGALLLTYMTADNLDGQHARRTHQSSALGEFLDHGLDGLASCAVLLCSAFALRVEGPWLAGLVGLGSLGFGGVFWAQYRTGVLVTPRVSAMEGVSGAGLFQIAVFALGEPSWLRFTPGVVSPASVLLVVLVLCYLYAIGSPVLRARRAGVALAELLGPVAVALAGLCYALAGAGGLAPSILVALYVADVVCRMILHRRRGERRSIVSPLHGLLLVPLAPAWLHLAPPDLCAWLGAACAIAMYGRSFLGGVVEISRDARPSPAT